MSMYGRHTIIRGSAVCMLQAVVVWTHDDGRGLGGGCAVCLYVCMSMYGRHTIGSCSLVREVHVGHPRS